jgi:hypothetical protein
MIRDTELLQKVRDTAAEMGIDALAIEETISEEQAAEIIGVTADVLRQRRCRGNAFLPWRKNGPCKSDRARYPLKPILEHLARTLKQPDV